MKKAIVKIISTLFPNQVVSFAYQKLTNPQLKKLRQNELLVLEKSEKETFKFQDFDIQLYTWQGGSKKILLVHGWEGQAGNFADIIEKLLEKNYTVHAFDAPSHGFSSKGRTSLFEFTELVGVLIRKYDVKKLLSHSFGGVAATYALFKNQDLKIDKYALLTVPDRFLDRINYVATQIGITQKVTERLIKRLENETKLQVDKLNVSDFVKTINVKKSLIIHDINDTLIPIAQSKNVHKNWENCTFSEVSGTGHFRILRTETVINNIVAFFENP